MCCTSLMKLCPWGNPELPTTSDIARCTHCQKENMMKHLGLGCACRAPLSPIHQHAPPTHLACRSLQPHETHQKVLGRPCLPSGQGRWDASLQEKRHQRQHKERFCSSQLCGQSCHISDKLDPLLWLLL